MNNIMTITSKGQVTFPKEILEALRLKKGDKIMAKLQKKQVLIKPLGRGILDLVGKMPKLNIPSGKTIDQLIHEAKDEYFRKVIR